MERVNGRSMGNKGEDSGEGERAVDGKQRGGQWRGERAVDGKQRGGRG